MNQTVKYQRVQDTSIYDKQGNRTAIRRYTVYIGDHGPFTIDVPITDPYDENAVQTAIQKLKTHLQVIGG
jgi:hypothetical protein